jgi:uncharacterized membrane protein (UPF0127 family)
VAAARLTRLPTRWLPGGVRIAEASTLRSRLLGLAFVRELDPRAALLLRPCSSVHTFGMRFAIDVVFLDEDGRVLDVRHHVRPGRVARRRGAAAALETRAGESWRFLRGGRLVR